MSSVPQNSGEINAASSSGQELQAVYYKYGLSFFPRLLVCVSVCAHTRICMHCIVREPCM